MRKFIVFYGLVAAIAVTAIQCRDSGADSLSQSARYKQLYITRGGGGDKSFYVAPVSGYSSLSFIVTERDFRDTNYTFSIGIRDGGRFVDYVRSILAEQIPLKGDYTPSKLPTGTWIRYFVVDAKNNMVEITNTEIRDRLAIIESWVTSGMESP
jgi:hypothetical protein